MPLQDAVMKVKMRTVGTQRLLSPTCLLTVKHTPTGVRRRRLHRSQHSARRWRRRRGAAPWARVRARLLRRQLRQRRSLSRLGASPTAALHSAVRRGQARAWSGGSGSVRTTPRERREGAAGRTELTGACGTGRGREMPTVLMMGAGETPAPRKNASSGLRAPS